MSSAKLQTEDRVMPRRFAGEAMGTAFLLAAVVGSGIMAEKLTQDIALQLLCNTLATGAVLFVLIVVFAPVSGAHFNPAVTLIATFSPRIAFLYVLAQIGGAILGVWLAHTMFGESVLALGVKTRTGLGQWLSEAVATFGLVLTIAGTSGRSQETTAASVALYIVAAYWFTASTSFANPAVTLGRSLTPTFFGITPWDAPGFAIAQSVGAVAAWLCARIVFSADEKEPSS